MRINIKKVEENVNELVKSAKFDQEFVYKFLFAYGKPQSSITRLKSGTYNLSKQQDEIFWKNNLFFKYVPHEDLHDSIDNIKHDASIVRHNPRFVIVTDFNQLLAVDTRTEETLDIPIKSIAEHYAFFLPWAGMEKAQLKTENVADVKAAERMAKLYDEIIRHNTKTSQEFQHSLNVFFSRLLFCFFAEDTEVFGKSQFTNSIESYTQEDGSDLDSYLNELFQALDVEDKSSNFPAHIKAFPYVNGGLFSTGYPAPKFNSQARKLIIECGELNWAQINPDIFGSMIQAVVHPGQRAGLGMHYTSVINIMKIIEPLFLEDLKEEFDKCYESKNRLEKLLQRIYDIKVFDPACGSGNFLIIAYKELRMLEHQILQRILEIEGKLALFKMSGIKLENFFGIEIDDFAHEIAILSLWLAKHQMNIEFKQLFGVEIPLIPLVDSGNIVCGNAARLDWDSVCLNDKNTEIYLIGNPPYLGSRNQKTEQKQDLESITEKYKSLDYISIWFIKGSKYIEESRSQLAFVSTNSITQGEQVGILWPNILVKNEIGFAHTSFKWTNNARGNAGVTCVVISLRNKSSSPKRLFINNTYFDTDKINAYLAPADDVYINRRSNPLSKVLPQITYGSMPNDKGGLILTTQQKDELISTHPNATKFIKRYIGSAELLRGQERWCLLISDDDLAEAVGIREIQSRLSAVSEHRKSSTEESTRSLASKPNHFYFLSHQETDSIIIPRVSSERRAYIPIGYLDKNTVIADSANAIYNAQPFVFGLISSRIHMCWVRAVAGQLETRIRYSSAIVYNNFPVPALSDKNKQIIENHVYEVLDAREKHSEKTLAELYDPDTMPADLQKAHRGLDEVVELCYRPKPFESDEERLAYLFKLYETMIQKEKE